MGREEEPVRGNANAANTLFERVIATKLRKRIEDEILSVVDDMDFSDDVSETMGEIVGEIVGSATFKSAIKARVLEVFEAENMKEKFAQRIVANMLKAS